MKKAKILCLDGGGIRGIIPAIIIRYVEEKAQELSNNPNLRIADLFDFVAGTSTGGILTCIYLTPNETPALGLPKTKYTAQDALDLYLENGFNIFNKSKIRWYNWRMLFNATRYNPHYLEKMMMEKFGDLKFSQLLKPALITTYDLKSESTFFFSSREPKSKKREFYVRDVARSTSAAPTYFPPARIKNLADPKHDMVNLDGGVFANNPTMCAYAEARDTKEGPIQEPSATSMIILSIGTGGGNLEMRGVNHSNRWGLLKWAEHIPNIMMDGSADTVAYQIQSIFNTLGEPKRRQYLRMDVPYQLRKTYSPDMADASSQNIKNLQEAAEETLAIKKAELDRMIQTLVNELETEKAHA